MSKISETYDRIKTLEYVRLTINLYPSIKLPLILNLLGLFDDIEHYSDKAVLHLVQKHYFSLLSQKKQ